MAEPAAARLAGLHLVTDSALCGERGLLAVVEAAVRGGVRVVQLREKTLATRPFVERARALKALLQPLGVPLIVNDRLDVALACGADGVHVGQEDLSPKDMRRWMPQGLIGLSIERLDQLDAAERLTGHKAFSMDNPNRFRALVSAFATGNPLRFHGADGAGYRFVADQALAMDRKNPQVAARLFGAFESWRRFAPHLSAAMQREVERVARADGLSKNLFEIATRSLG